MRRSVIGTVLITVLVIGALGAIGYGLYSVGYTQGLAQDASRVVVNAPRMVHPGAFWGHGFGIGFGFFGIFFKILLFALIIGLIARLFFGPRRWGYGPGPYWGGGWHDGTAHPAEQRLNDWHQKAHGEPGAQEQTPPPPPPTDQSS